MAGPVAEEDRQGGFITIEYLLAVALSLVVLVVIANFIVFEYGQGVVRTAVDQGARAGARAPAAGVAGVCQRSAQQVIDDLLGGPKGSMGGGVHISCSEGAGSVSVVAQARFPAWFRPIPDWSFTTKGSAVLEPAG